MASHSRPGSKPTRHQDPRVISTFEVIGSYFCDTFFNHVYNSAQAHVAGGASLTDEYVRRAKAYLLGVKTDAQCYSDVVQGVHRYFTATTRYTTIGFGEFVDRTVSLCVPEDYFAQFSENDKDELLSSIICDLVSNLAAYTTTDDMLRRIIDEHDQNTATTVRMLQDAAVEYLVAKRNSLQNKFISKIGQAREHVTLDQVEDMKRVMRRLVKEKAEAVASEKKAWAEVAAVRQAAKVREAKYRKLVKLLKAGAERGPASAGGGLRVPRADNIAERDPFAGDPEGYVPRRDRIAEPGRAHGSDSEDSASPGRAPARHGQAPARPPAPAPARDRRGARPPRPGVSADFFKGGPLPLPAGDPSRAPEAPPARPLPESDVLGAGGPVVRSGPPAPSALFASLFSDAGFDEFE